MQRLRRVLVSIISARQVLCSSGIWCLYNLVGRVQSCKETLLSITNIRHAMAHPCVCMTAGFNVKI